MDASQYKDYILVLLFVKYVSDKYAGVSLAPITIPPGAGFKDMVELKGKSDIGDQINTTILAPLANANKLSDMPDFNDATKLGSGKDMVDRLTNLIAIFENPALDFPPLMPLNASSTTVCRRPSRATTPTCCTSCARSNPPARAPASCRTACCPAGMPRRSCARTWSSAATSRP